ncbi:cholinesterase [Trichonephila clavipes]|uniref:Cholinesterase n=1 Tax=Trichonephila clavipes TaxID=2585209 RepID=A0A8X6VUS6_TRICX|nr:cholinesterase [Trichonephila clavipes]
MLKVLLASSSAAQAVDFWPGPEDLPSWSWNQYRKYVTTSLDSFDPRISQLTMQLYNTSETYDEDPTPELLYTTMVTDIRQTCPVNDFTDMLSSVTNSPVFRYVITSRPSAPVIVFFNIIYTDLNVSKVILLHPQKMSTWKFELKTLRMYLI